MFLSYQDYRTVPDTPAAKAAFIRRLIDWHITRPQTVTARDADLYDRQCNSTITRYTKTYYTLLGRRVPDYSSSANRIASNFFHKLNTQRCAYSLGNGLTFTKDGTKERLGSDFDTDLYNAAYKALIHGVSFCFWNLDHLHCFPLTEFAPLWDEDTGALMAGVRFWNIDPDKPETAVLYEADGYTVFRAQRPGDPFSLTEEKRPYRCRVQIAGVDRCPVVVGADNYSALPIIPLYGSRYKQSTLVGMKAAIDSYDLIRSGFADDLQDCAECYWTISNADGMDDEDLQRFRDRLKYQHIAQADIGQVQSTVVNLPYQARQEYLQSIRAGIFEDFGGLDVHTVAAGATNDHIDAAYQSLDEHADDFEYQIITAVRKILALMGVDDTPVFKRNRLSNTKEQTDMVIAAAQYLDQETILRCLPFVTVDDIARILRRKQDEDPMKFSMTAPESIYYDMQMNRAVLSDQAAPGGFSASPSAR